LQFLAGFRIILAFARARTPGSNLGAVENGCLAPDGGGKSPRRHKTSLGEI